MTDLEPVPDDLFADLLATLRDRPSRQVPASRLAQRELVALSTSFDPSELGQDSTAAPISVFLGEDCESVVSSSGTRWRLHRPIRRRTLRDLELGQRLDTVHPLDPEDVTGRLARAYVRRQAPPVSLQTPEELAATLTVADWLRETHVPVPEVVEVKARLELETMLSPLRMLVADGFFGRHRELAELATYVTRAGDEGGRLGLAVLGPGGVGKSSLLARFLLSELEVSVEGQRPFAYMSFDRSELAIDEPLKLLAEAARQLAAQRPSLAGEASKLAYTAEQSVARARREFRDRRGVRSKVSSSLSRSAGDEEVLLTRFGKLIDRATTDVADPPVWVLDTFEVAQRQGGELLTRLWDFLHRLLLACPALRLVFVGRAPIEGFPLAELLLGDLDPGSARAFLVSHLADIELPAGLLDRVLEAVPPYPLTLRLTAILISSRAAGGLRTPAEQDALLLGLGEEQVQGILYRRILDHIDDRDVRALAYPGLVVRRITREVISGFLAEACGLGLAVPPRAELLFRGLEREVALVQPGGPGVLVQRPEFRGLYLRLVERTQAEQVEVIRAAALRFYTQDHPDKVEELYYRLALDQDVATLEAAFDPVAARALEGIAEELPVSAQAYLSSRLGLSVRPELLQAADELTWARQVSISARRLLDAGLNQEAYDLLMVRTSERVVPYVAPLAVECLAALGRQTEALDRADWDLAWAAQHGDPELYVELALIAARIAEDVGLYQRALGWLRTAASTAVPDRLGVLSAQTAILRIHRRVGSLSSSEARQIRAAVVTGASELGPAEQARNATLVRELAAEVGDEVPWLTAATVSLSGHGRMIGDADAVYSAGGQTYSEVGEQVLGSLGEDQTGSVQQEVVEDLRRESDEAAF